MATKLNYLAITRMLIRRFRARLAGVVLGANAMQALDRLGVHDAVRAAGFPITRISLLDRHGRILNDIDTTPFTRRIGYENLAIHRADLQRILLANLPPSVVQLGKSLERFEEKDSWITAYFTDGSHLEGQTLIGADGIRSRVRRGDEIGLPRTTD